MNDNQRLLLNAFKQLIKFFDKHHLIWWIDGGTLLGAVRDHHFIPWDDDIDIMMPRKDFDILSSLMHADARSISKDLFFQDPITDPDYMNIHARLRIDGTENISARETNLASHKGIFIDIYPLDYVNSDNFKNKRLTNALRWLCKNTDVEANKPYLQKTTRPRMAYQIFHEKLRTMSESSSKSFAFPACFWRYSKYSNMKFSASLFCAILTTKFETLTVNIPVGYDKILSTWYGKDYMTPKKEPSFHS